MTLTAKDIADLERIESEIEKDTPSALRWLENLSTIRKRKLFLSNYKTFESYCELRWGWTRRWVNMQMKAADVLKTIPATALETPVVLATLITDPEKGGNLGSPISHLTTSETVGDALNERHLRELGTLPAKERGPVLTHAAQRGPITAASIAESAKVIHNASMVPEVPEPPKRKDETDWPIPDCRLDLFKRAEQVTKMLHNIAEIRGFVRKAMDHGSDPLFREFHPGDVLMACDNVHAELKLIVPYAVCPVCQGIKADACKACCFRGVLSKYRWDTAIPEELKRMRQATLADKGA